MTYTSISNPTYKFTAKNTSLNYEWLIKKAEAFLSGDPDPYFFDFVDIELA